MVCLCVWDTRSGFPLNTHRGISVKILSKKFVYVWRQINILTEAFLYHSYKQDQSSIEGVVKGDFF